MSQLAGASIAARTTGAVKQYQLNATNSSATVTPYDSGSIIGHVQPGGSGEKLVSGVIQTATDLTADSTAGKVGNALLANQNGQNYSTDPFTADAGLSLAPQHE